MRKSIFFVIALCAMLSASVYNAAAQNQESREMKVGTPMPEFVLNSDVHGELSSADLKGEVVLMTFFATWCGPCQKELAAVQEKLWPVYKNKKGFRLVVVGREHTDEQLKDYNEIKKFSFPMYPDPKREVYSKFADITIPRAYLFGKDGKLIHASKGFEEGDMEKVMKMIEEAL